MGHTADLSRLLMHVAFLVALLFIVGGTWKRQRRGVTRLRLRKWPKAQHPSFFWR